jgi:hypothetical protein
MTVDQGSLLDVAPCYNEQYTVGDLLLTWVILPLGSPLLSLLLGHTNYLRRDRCAQYFLLLQAFL